MQHADGERVYVVRMFEVRDDFLLLLFYSRSCSSVCGVCFEFMIICVCDSFYLPRLGCMRVYVCKSLID